MDIPLTDKIKQEPIDESEDFVPALTPSQGLIEFFLDNDYKKEENGYYYNKVKCLDETDGKFKNFADVSSNQVKVLQEGDFKNYCSKCDKQFDSLLAAQNHYLFTHPDSSILGSILPRTYQGKAYQKRFYNWLDEPIRLKVPIKIKEQSNIIIIKDQQEYFKKLSSTKKLVQATENLDKGYTLESIKAKPLQGIRVVKKSDIQFDRLRTKAEKKLLCSRKPEHQVRAASPKKIAQHDRQLIKVDIKEAFNATSNLKLFNEFAEKLAQEKNMKYLCTQCNLELPDPFVFDAHMRQHISATFGCSFCTRKFCTKIGIAKHTELCKKNASWNGVKIISTAKTT